MKEPGSRDKGRRKRPGELQHSHTISTVQGTVKWFNPVKGFGFITPDDASRDVFVHVSAVERAELTNLTEGMKVQWETLSDAAGEPQGASISLTSPERISLSEEVDAQLESSVEIMTAAATEAINRIDLAVQRITKTRQEIESLKTKFIVHGG
jgi:cold shock protein